MAPWERALAVVLVIAALLTLILFPSPASHILRLPWALSLSHGSPLHLDQDNLGAALSRYPFLVLDCYYPGCGPCMAMNQTVEELSEELRGQITFGLINARSNQNFTKQYRASNYPVLFLFKDGNLSARLVGDRSKEYILEELKKLKPDLDTSQVKSATAQNATAPITLSKEMRLAKLGIDNPDNPMPVSDRDLGLALSKYPFLVLDAYVSWCEPCHRMNQTVSELSAELQGQVAFGMLDVEENDVAKARYNITSYPTFLIFENGRLVYTFIGTRSKTSFLQELKCSNPGLDTSNFQIPSASAPASAPAAKPAALIQEIPLAKLGIDNPDKPMLINDQSLQEALNKYPLFVLEGFADWCDHCHIMNLTLSELAGEMQGQAAFGLIDAQDNKETKKEYNITSYPTILIFKDGVLKDKLIGNQQKSSFVAKLKKIDPSLNTSRVKISLPKAPGPAKPKLSPEQVCANMTKSDRPLLEAFVVSRCPFGLQMQRILADMIRNVPAAKSNVKVMYIGIVSNGTTSSMHGVEEAQENLRQICIREEQSDKYWDYVGCYMKEGKTEDCLRSETIDQIELSSCLEDPGRGLAYAQKDFDLAEENKITGSPTLMMNGKIVKESNFATNTTRSRSTEALKELLCCGFMSQPSFCSLQLNKTQAVTMFSVKAHPTAAAAQAQPAQIDPARLGEKNPRQPMLVTDKTLSSAINQYPLLVLEGYATWCGYSQMMNATLAELAEDLQGQVAFGLIDAEKNKQTKTEYNISSYPTTLIFKDGKLIDTVVGDQQKSSLVARLEKIDPVLDTSKVETSPLPVQAQPTSGL